MSSEPRVVRFQRPPGGRHPMRHVRPGMTVEQIGEHGATARQILAQMHKGRLVLDRAVGLVELRDILGEEQPPRPGVRRPCITCRTLFLSTGPGHRMCERCRRLATESYEP